MRHSISRFLLISLTLVNAEDGQIPKVGLFSMLPYFLEQIPYSSRPMDLPSFFKNLLSGPVNTLTYLLDPSSAGTADEKVIICCSSRDFPVPSQVFMNQSSTFLFNFSLPTYFVMHGYIDGDFDPYGLLRMAPPELLKYEDANVCTVDWSLWASYDYSTAIGFMFQVGEHLAKFIKLLHNEGLNYDHLTLIGHSLGAHGVGWAGSLLDGQVDLIIGTDPAGLGFCPPFQFLPSEKRLNATCAKRVQTINTNLVVGCGIPLGHANFYPDLGMLSPGCGLRFITCNHYEANYYLLGSLNPDNQFVGVQCKDQAAAVLDDLFPTCNYSSTNIMGLRTQRREGNFFLWGTSDFLPKPYKPNK